MAATGVKFDEGTGGFAANCFPVRTLLRTKDDGGGAWLVAQKAEQRRRFKAVLCARPRTYSQIREERKRVQKEGAEFIPPVPPVQDEEEAEDNNTLDGFFLMKHCCVEDPTDLCSVNISGLGLSEVKEDDLALFDNVAYVNASENILPFVAFRGFAIIRELELSINGIRGIKVDPADYPNLEILDLSYNNLSQEDLLALGLLPKLRVLTLTGNGLTSLPPDLTRPEFGQGLKQLNLDSNEIFSVPQLMLVEGKHVMTETASSKRRTKSNVSSRRSQNSSRKTPRSAKRKDKSELKTDEKEQDKKDSTLEDKKNDIVDAVKEKTTDDKNDNDKPADEFNFAELELEDLNLGEFDPERPSMTQDNTDSYMGDDIGPALPPFAELRSISLANNQLTPAAPPNTAQVLSSDGSVTTGFPKEPLQSEKELPLLPPFPALTSLSLVSNQIYDEECLLPVAAWPMLQELIIHSNPLTTMHSGDPPLLKRFLQDKLGISLIRKKGKEYEKPHIEVTQNPDRKVDCLVPRVQKRNIDDILLALEGPKQEALPPSSQREETLQGKQTPLPPISPSKDPTEEMVTDVPDHGNKEQTGDAFFMTQVTGQEEETTDEKKSPKKTEESGKMRKKKKRVVPDKYKLYDILLDAEDDPDQPLPKDIQGSVRALHYTLNHPNIYRHNKVQLDKPQPSFQPYTRTKAPESVKRKTRPEKVEEALSNLKERTTVIEAPLDEVLKQKKNKDFAEAPQLLSERRTVIEVLLDEVFKKQEENNDFPEAPQLLSEIQRRYNMVRATSMKEARDAKKLLQETITNVSV